MTTKESDSTPPTDTQMEETSHAPTGFTAVNGVNGRTSPKPSKSPPPALVQTQSPTGDAPKTNGITHPKSSTAGSPSPVDSRLDQGQADTPSSQHSPPTRKRSFPEAFGDPDNKSYHARAPESQASPEPRHSVEHAGSLQERPNVSGDPDHRRPLTSDYDPHAPVAQNYYSHTLAQDDSDQRMAEALRRETEDHGHRRESFASPDTDDQQRQRFSEYEISRSGAVQVDNDRKRRKRVFSNRTKTGCMTCRKRKKKCDEQHPECNNCLRGGFVCEGYTVRNTWQKPSPAKAPIPLQSKNGQYGTAQPLPHGRYPEVNPEYGALPKGELRPMDDGRRMSPPSQERPPQPWAPNAPHPYSGPPPPPHQKYPERPMDRPLAQHENPHELPDPSAYPMTTAHLNHHGQASGPPPQHQHPQPHGPPPAHAANPHQGPPNLSLPVQSQSPISKRPPPPRNEMSEREKMLRGEYYLPYTPALIADREQCALAVWRFNNSTNPSTGIAPEDRMNFFKKILSLRPTPDPSAPMPGPHDPPPDPAFIPNGQVGPGVVVEAPFHCDYGYNISIGSDVVIGADCRITDTCNVSIGNNVVFSPGVKLVCATYAIDPRERRKGKGRALGRNIVIEDDAWIGSNVTILPGVRVGRCSTVGAGSLLHKDVPPFTVVAGNPPKVVRGIYDDGRS